MNPSPAWRRKTGPLPHRAPQARRTIGLIAWVLLALCGTDAWQLWRVYEAQLRDAEVVTSNIARLVAAQADSTLRTADTIVSTLVGRVEAEGAGSEARRRLYGLMTSLAAALPAIHEMGVTDQAGNAIVKSLIPDPTGLNYADRRYFAYHRDHPDRGPFIGPSIASKIDGSLNITVTRRVNSPDGSFGGLVVASVSMGFFQRLFDQMQGRGGGVIALLSEEGGVLARSPATADPTADLPVRTALIVHERGQGPDGTVDYRAESDGGRRLGALQQLEGFPLKVLVSQTYWGIESDWRDQLVWHGLILAGVTLMVLVLGAREIRATQKLDAQAMQDGLTGLPNRRCFDERLAHEFRRAARSGQPLSLILIDIDRFKPYNDHHGHPGGDACLCHMADVIRGSLHRAADFAARYGGEEFAVLLPGMTAAQALAFADTLVQAARDLAVPHAPAVGGIVTLSAGVATCRPSLAGTDPVGLVQAADAALYAAKDRGRNTVVQSAKSVLATAA